MTFNTEPTVEGATTRVILDANPSFGVAFGVHFEDVNLVEFRWVRQDTEMRVTGAVVLPRQRVLLDQYHFVFSHEYVVREWPAWARPYIMGSLGWTRIAERKRPTASHDFHSVLGEASKCFHLPTSVSNCRGNGCQFGLARR
jgi:hypothetical protein